MSNLPSNSLQEGEHNLQEMKTKSPAWSSKGYHMYKLVVRNVFFSSSSSSSFMIKFNLKTGLYIGLCYKVFFV